MSIYRFTTIANHINAGAQYNTHHYEFPGYVPTDAERDEVAQGLADLYEEQLLNIFSDQVNFDEIEVRRVDIGDQPSATYVPTGWPVTGGRTEPSLPSQVALTVRWNAPTEYPRSGRIYLPSTTTGALTQTGRIQTATRTILDALATNMEEIPVTGQVDAQRVAVQYGGDPRVVVASNLLFARTSSSVWGIQRRRRPGSGI